jgi:hypothetical protein
MLTVASLDSFVVMGVPVDRATTPRIVTNGHATNCPTARAYRTTLHATLQPYGRIGALTEVYRRVEGRARPAGAAYNRTGRGGVPGRVDTHPLRAQPQG